MSPEGGPITVVLATDSFLIGDGPACMLDRVDEVNVVGGSRDHHELITMVDELGPEVALIGIRTPVVATMATVTAARQLRDEHPELGIVVISDCGNGFALELRREGASRVANFLDARLPGMEAVLGALREVRAGQSVPDPSVDDAPVHRRAVTTVDDLTPREVDVPELIARGRPTVASPSDSIVRSRESRST